MTDIDRIEVIRGPGAALWGANAVNGVINIITKNSRDTLGTVISGGVGTDVHARAEIRDGTRIGNDASLRFYAKARQQGSETTSSGGADAKDNGKAYQAGVRSDWTPQNGQALMLSSDVYSVQFNALPNAISPQGNPTTASGANVMARWTGGAKTDSSWKLQSYYDHYNRDVYSNYSEKRGTFDLDFQHQLQLNAYNTLIYGLGYRTSHDGTGGPPAEVLLFQPQSRTLDTENVFVQNQLGLYENRLVITAGSKFEHNNFNRLAVEPSLRVGWHATPHSFTWAAISSAVRTPNRLESDVAVYCPPPNGFPGACGPGVFKIGNPSLESEKVLAYEWGLRLWNESNVSLDLATYYNHYTNLRSTEGASASAPFGSYENKAHANSYGGELVLDWQPRTYVNLQAFYDYLHLTVSLDADSTDTTTVNTLEGSDPRHQAGLRMNIQPYDRWTINGSLRYVDGLSYYAIPAYTELNLRIAYQLRPGLELAVSGQNLLQSHHPEFGNTNSRDEIDRSGQLGFTWQWQ